MTRKFEKVEEYGIIPKRQTKNSAGYDFYIPQDIIINPNEKISIPLGVAVKMGESEVLLINIRSSIGMKQGVILSNIQGVIDSDFYPNEIHLGLWNTSNEIRHYSKGERLCQGIFINYLTADENEEELQERKGGIGSTDKSLNKLVVICGASCSGKDWFVDKLVKHKGYIRMPTVTTRPMRENESEGREYNFLNKEEFSRLSYNNEIIGVRKFTAFLEGDSKEGVDYFYGIWNKKSEYINTDKKYVMILDPAGIKEISEVLGEENLFVIYLDAQGSVRQERCKKRGNYIEKEWERRLIRDKEDFYPERFCLSSYSNRFFVDTTYLKEDDLLTLNFLRKL